MNRKVMGLIWDAVRKLGTRDIIFIVINNIFGILGSSINPLIIKYLMDGVQSHNEISFWFWLKVGIFYNIMTYLVFNIFFIGSGITIDVKNSTNFYKKWFDKIVTLDGQYFDNKGSSKVSSITNDCTNGMSNISNIFFYSILPSFFRITSAFVFIYIFAGRKFFLIGLTIFVLYIYITYRAQSKARPNRKEQHKNNHNRGKHMNKVLASKTENLISNKISHEVGILKDFLDRTLKISITRAYIILPQNTQNIISPLSKLAAYFYFFENYYNKSITLGSIYIINDSINRIFANIGDVVDLANNITDHFTKLEEFQTEIVEAPQMIGYYDGHKYIYKGGDINIENISFAYNKFKSDKLPIDSSEKSLDVEDPKQLQSKYIFKNFSLKIAGGRKIAFVGASGGGKTTLVKLILGLLNTNEGQIYIDDQKLPNIYTTSDEYISLSSYYHYVGYLSQDPGVFDGNILDNLLYGLTEVENKSNEIKSEYTSDIKKDAINGRLYNDIFASLSEEDQKYFTEEVIEKLSKYVSTEGEPSEMAGKYSDLIAKVKGAIADSKCNFVRDYDDGLLAQIGERGVKLSGGQKQRLAIAKLMIKNPKLIILDEPTSALDSFSEDGVTGAMERLFVDRTIIIIAHRLQTVKKADEIIVLENNKDGGSYIAERGNHEELVKNGGIYAKMLDLQSGF